MLLSWDLAALIAAALLALSFVLKRAPCAPARSTEGVAREASVVLALYSLWQWGGGLAITHVAGAVRNALWVWRVERDMHLPSELDVQRLVLPHPLVVQFLNVFYDVVHVPALIIFLLWLYFRHRDSYVRWRNIGALTTLATLLLQTIPVAPPRLMPQLGFVDTALQYHQSVYGAGGIGNATQLAAMPSVHVAWSLFIAVAVISVSRSRWRWFIILHPALTVFTVVATANHWWLDGIVAAGLLVLSMALEWAVRRGVGRVVEGRRPERRVPAIATPLPEPAPR